MIPASIATVVIGGFVLVVFTAHLMDRAPVLGFTLLAAEGWFIVFAMFGGLR